MFSSILTELQIWESTWDCSCNDNVSVATSIPMFTRLSSTCCRLEFNFSAYYDVFPVSVMYCHGWCHYIVCFFVATFSNSFYIACCCGEQVMCACSIPFVMLVTFHRCWHCQVLPGRGSVLEPNFFGDGTSFWYCTSSWLTVLTKNRWILKWITFGNNNLGRYLVINRYAPEVVSSGQSACTYARVYIGCDALQMFLL